MTLDEALDILDHHRRGRAGLPEAVAVARAARFTHQEIADRAGLSRDGVRKILARQEIDPTGPDATQATVRDQASQNSHATENGDQP